MTDQSKGHQRHLFLSPHYDDIALSCGGTVALLHSRGHTPEIALIFGESPDPGQALTPFAAEMHLAWGLDPAAAIAARQQEENAALALIGARERVLPFRDAIYRGERYDSDAALFGRPAEDEAGLAGDIVAALDLDDTVRDRLTIYAPLAIGMHVDHQIAFEASLLLQNAGYTVRWYEDLPYALEPEWVSRRIDTVAGPIVPGESVAVSEVWETKIDAIMAYPSQLAVIFERFVGVEPSRAAISDALLQYAESVGDGFAVERFWKPADAAS